MGVGSLLAHIVKKRGQILTVAPVDTVNGIRDHRFRVRS